MKKPTLEGQRWKGKDRDEGGKGADASHLRRNTTPDTVLDPPEASIGLEDAPEDPIAEEVSDEEEDLGEEGNHGSERVEAGAHASTSRFATSELAPVLIPDRTIPGLVRVDVS